MQTRNSERADQNKLSRANLIQKTYNRHGDPSLSSVLPPVLAIVNVFHDIFGGNELFELNCIEHRNAVGRKEFYPNGNFFMRKKPSVVGFGTLSSNICCFCI